jgi:hypothetical protein
MRVVTCAASTAVVLFFSANVFAAQPGWLTRVNDYRAQAGVNPVVEDPELSRIDLLHAKYSVLNKVLQHSEEQGKPGYSADGDRAARTSNGAYAKEENDAIDQWMQAPFHALGILDPRLKTTGFGLYTDSTWSSAWLNVIAGMGALPPETRFPIYWPGAGSTTPLLKHWGETPEPTHSCPGYATPTGLPILIQLKPGTHPEVTDSSFTDETGASLAHCVIDETNFRYEDTTWQSTGRSILASRNAIILLPRDPLKAGKTYKASITSGGQTFSWHFSTTR